jgi:death-on-curing protein
MAPRLLNLEELVLLYEDPQGRRHGVSRVRDLGRLRAALALRRPGAHDERALSDLFEIAAAYLFHLSREGGEAGASRRAGTEAALVFLELNRVTIDMDEQELAGLASGISTGTIPRTAAAEVLRRRALP